MDFSCEQKVRHLVGKQRPLYGYTGRRRRRRRRQLSGPVLQCILMKFNRVPHPRLTAITHDKPNANFGRSESVRVGDGRKCGRYQTDGFCDLRNVMIPSPMAESCGAPWGESSNAYTTTSRMIGVYFWPRHDLPNPRPCRAKAISTKLVGMPFFSREIKAKKISYIFHSGSLQTQHLFCSPI